MNRRFIIHKACYDMFKDQKYERAKKRKSMMTTSTSEIESSSKRITTRSQASETVPFGQQLCMYCNEPDKFDKSLQNLPWT
jgi:hypothetical protein